MENISNSSDRLVPISFGIFAYSESLTSSTPINKFISLSSEHPTLNVSLFTTSEYVPMSGVANNDESE